MNELIAEVLHHRAELADSMQAVREAWIDAGINEALPDADLYLPDAIRRLCDYVLPENANG